MQVPNFLRLEGEALLYNGAEGTEFCYYVPEEFFSSASKKPIAEIDGQYVSMIGLCNWCIVDKNGKRSDFKPFNFPTMFMCKPAYIEKAKGIDILENNNQDDVEESPDLDEQFKDIDDENKNNKDYRILHFNPGDEVVHQVRVPKIIDNVELFYKLAVITAKIPNTIPYDEGWKLFLESMALNDKGYGLNAQLFGIVWGGLCRDPKNIARPFRMTSMSNMNAYKPISIKLLPNYISPYTSIISENWDESLRSAILMKDMAEEDIPYSPLEKVTME